MFLINSRFRVLSATLNAQKSKPRHVLSPPYSEVTGAFCRVPSPCSLDRLGILYLSTCVGLGYGPLITRSRSFSRQHRITNFWNKFLPIRSQAHKWRICLPLALHPWPGTTIARYGYLPASLRSLSTTRSVHRLSAPSPRRDPAHLACLASLASTRSLFRGYGNINPLSIDYACRPRLRSRLTQGRLA